MYIERRVLESLSFGHEPHMTALEARECIQDARRCIALLDSHSCQLQHPIVVVQVGLQRKHGVELFLELGGRI